jgi:ABC-type lipoprotein export system ATPase subunit
MAMWGLGFTSFEKETRLVSHPKIVLADEPTAALERKSGRDVLEIMQRLTVG